MMNPPITAVVPMRPNSSAITAKMKSLWAYGRYPSLPLPPPMPEPVMPARRDAQVSLVDLVGEVVLLLGDVREGREAGEATRARHDEEQRDRRRRRRSTVARWVIGTPAIHATDSTMAASTMAEPRSPWARQMPAPTPASRAIGTIARRRLDHVVDPTGEKVGGEHDDGELEELRRLDAEAAEPDPRAGAVHAGAEARGERQGHGDHTEHAERDHELPPDLVRDTVPRRPG